MELTKIKGQDRYVVHFFELLTDEEKALKVDEAYKIALHKARQIGGKAYRGSNFGGGIVFQSVNTTDLITKIVSKRYGKTYTATA